MTKKYYLGTEFAEERGSIKLISIGIKCEDGRTFYAENSSFDIRDANDWVQKNAYPSLKWFGKDFTHYSSFPLDTNHVEVYGSPIDIRDAIKEFITETPVFYAYYGAYDWVVFCWIFGAMIDLPDGYPMFAHDLKPMLDDCEGLKKPADPINEHNALIDAIWNEELHTAILNNKES